MEKYKIGLANGLLYHDYKDLIDNFFNELNISYLVSNESNKKTLEDGKRLLVDESCISLKLYFGHIKYLIDKCEYILIIRCPSINKKEMMCTNFYALYDLANNLFPNKIIELNIDVNNGISIKKAFINLGKRLGCSKKESYIAFKKAYNYFLYNRELKYQEQLNLLKSNKKKILLVGHNYNLNDNYISGDIKKLLKNNDIEIILSNYFKTLQNDDYKEISKSLYWSKNIDILKSIAEYKNYIDGIILISAFPCGPDSLVNEMIMRKINVPILNLVIDEVNDNGGIVTRVESFIDIISMKDGLYD